MPGDRPDVAERAVDVEDDRIHLPGPQDRWGKIAVKKEGHRGVARWRALWVLGPAGHQRKVIDRSHPLGNGERPVQASVHGRIDTDHVHQTAIRLIWLLPTALIGEASPAGVVARSACPFGDSRGWARGRSLRQRDDVVDRRADAPALRSANGAPRIPLEDLSGDASPRTTVPTVMLRGHDHDPGPRPP
jgi:hypothetical protein